MYKNVQGQEGVNLSHTYRHPALCDSTHVHTTILFPATPLVDDSEPIRQGYTYAKFNPCLLMYIVLTFYT